MRIRKRQGQPLWTVVTALLMGFSGAVSSPPCAAAERGVRFNLLELPSSRAAQHVVGTEARFFWENRPLRDGLRELSQHYQVTIWLDRRIDPTQTITLPSPAAEDDVRLMSRLQRIAAMVGAEAGLIENVVYVAPTGALAPAQRAAVELHDALSRQQHSSTRTTQREWAWPELSTPADLLRQLQADWKVPIEGQLPHDLMHAGELRQPSTLATQCTLLLAGFDCEAEATGSHGLRIVPLERKSRWRANYPVSELQLSARDRETDIQVEGGIASVSGTTAQHLALLATRPARPVAGRRALDDRKWTFQVQNAPVAAVLEKLSAAIGFQLDWDPGVTPEHRAQLISLEVTDADLDQILAEVARQSGLAIARAEEAVRVAAEEVNE